MLNNLVLMGRLTKDPTTYGENKDVTFFDIAVDNPTKESDGSRGTSFFTCKCFKNLAINVAKFARKGDKVAVIGSIQQRNFLRKDGTKGTSYEIIANSVEFLSPKPEDEPIDEPALRGRAVCGLCGDLLRRSV